MWEMWSAVTWQDIGVWLLSTIAAAVVAEALTEILTASKLLQSFHSLLASKAFPLDPNNIRWWWLYLHTLATCGYCASVWVAFVVCLSIPGGYFQLLPWNNILFKTILCHRLSNWIHVAYELLRRGRIITIDLTVASHE